MTYPGPSPTDAAGRDGVTLRLLWPQWQGAGTSSVAQLASEFPFGITRRGYAVGSAVLAAVLPPHEGPTAVAPVTFSHEGLEEGDGIEAKTVIVRQLAGALDVIRRHDPAQIVTLGGERRGSRSTSTSTPSTPSTATSSCWGSALSRAA